MTDGRYDEVQLIYPCMPEFDQKLMEFDASIDLADFKDWLRAKASTSWAQKRRENPTEAEEKGFDNNIEFQMALEFTHELETLVQKYLNMRSDSKQHREHQARMSALENRFAGSAGMDEIPLGPEIDMSGKNGMTVLGEAIVNFASLEDIEDLVEVKGASPVALCGKTLPSDLAEQLGRADVAEYLRGMAQFAN